jgi:hypothetical protein
MKKETKYLIGFIVIMCLLTPLGLIAEGSAWGEWDIEEFNKIVGFIPKSIAEFKPIIEPFIPDYEIKSIGKVASSIISAIIGASLSIGIIWAIKMKNKKGSI